MRPRPAPRVSWRQTRMGIRFSSISTCDLGIRDIMTIEFDGDIWYWKGPAPFHFVTVPAKQCQELKAVSKTVTYGWGMIPATVRIGQTEWATALFPKDGRYIVPLKDSVRKAESLEEGDQVSVRLEVR